MARSQAARPQVSAIQIIPLRMPSRLRAITLMAPAKVLQLPRRVMVRAMAVTNVPGHQVQHIGKVEASPEAAQSVA
jgi:hypothetical protein